MILQFVVHVVFILTSVGASSARTQQLKELRKQYKELLNEQKIYNESICKEQRRVRQIHHNLKNHFINLYTLIESERYTEALLYLKKIDNVIFDFPSLVIDTGNPLLDMMVSMKQKQCEGYFIKFSAPALIFHRISESDISLLLASALDNSIEACQKIENVSCRRITVELTAKTNILVIKIENSIKRGTAFKTGVSATTKSDKKEHGFGTETMKAIVKKYEGELYFERNDSNFIVRAILYDDTVLTETLRQYHYTENERNDD